MASAFAKSARAQKVRGGSFTGRASPIARLLLDLLDEHSSWSSTASELLNALEAKVTEQSKRQSSWPKNGRSMSGHLKRIAPNLRALGWQIDFGRQAKQRLVTIQRVPETASLPSPASFHNDDRRVQSDADGSELFPNDVPDGNDATAGLPMLPQDRNGENQEEGEI